MAYLLYPEVRSYSSNQNVGNRDIAALETILERVVLLGNREALDDLLAWERDHNLSNYRNPLRGEPAHLSRQEGTNLLLQLAQTPAIIGLSGRPAVGKTYFLKELSRRYGVEIIDEFSPERIVLFGYDDEEFENSNQRRAIEIVNSGKPVIVASARVDGHVHHKFYLDRTWSTRARNTLKQLYKLRRLSVVLNFRQKRAHERYAYEFQKMSSDGVIDLHR